MTKAGQQWSKRRKILPGEVPSILQEVIGLQRLSKPKPSIYFLLQDGEVVYVGQTTNPVPLRIASHRRDKEFNDVLFYHVESKKVLLQVEAMWIRHFRPRYNVATVSEIDPVMREVALAEMERSWDRVMAVMSEVEQ